jgi:hypothetical protein
MATDTVIDGSFFATHSLSEAARVLLINPPIHDYRLDWGKWHYPLGLLQVGKLLTHRGAEVRLIDCLSANSGKMPKQKIGVQAIDGYEFIRWRFGLPYPTLRARLREVAGWKPDCIMMTSLNSLWWEGVADTIDLVRDLLPGTPVVLGGKYPTFAPTHAASNSGADVLVRGSVPEVSPVGSGFVLDAQSPQSAGIQFYTETRQHAMRSLQPRPEQEIVEELVDGIRCGVREFVFFDEKIHFDDSDALKSLLAAIAAARLDVRLALPGNLPPAIVDRTLAQLLRSARVQQLYLRCELSFMDNRVRYADDLAVYEHCTQMLVEHGGYRPRAGEIAAMLVVGLPFEDLNEVCERLIRLAHIVGSVLLVPFQYVPGLHDGATFRRALAANGALRLEDHNGKTFPMARLSGRSLEEYLELVRLAALLNSKYRSKTFDFLGDNLAARLLRESLRSGGWNPFGEQPATQARAALVDIPLSSRPGRRQP